MPEPTLGRQNLSGGRCHEVLPVLALAVILAPAALAQHQTTVGCGEQPRRATKCGEDRSWKQRDCRLRRSRLSANDNHTGQFGAWQHFSNHQNHAGVDFVRSPPTLAHCYQRSTRRDHDFSVRKHLHSIRSRQKPLRNSDWVQNCSGSAIAGYRVAHELRTFPSNQLEQPRAMERSRVQLSAFILGAARMLPWHPCGAQSSSCCPVQVRHIQWQASSTGFSPYKHRGLEVHLQYMNVTDEEIKEF